MKFDQKITRRKFITMVALAGTAAFLPNWPKNLQKNAVTAPVKVSRMIMGTVVNLVIIDDDEEKAKTAALNCLDKMSNLEKTLSRFNHNSQLSHLNMNGFLSNPDAALIDVLNLAKTIGDKSNGAFDISIKPVIDLYFEEKLNNRLPLQTKLSEQLALVNYKNIVVSGDLIKFQKPNMQITLDGIGKGYIIDQGVESIKAMGYSHVMVEAGGDLFACGEKFNKQPWKIGIQSPRKAIRNCLGEILLTNQALATSGDYMQFFSLDLVNHHIINPTVGHSSTKIASASVIAPNTALADALATSLMVLEIGEGLTMINSIPDCECLIVTKNMEILNTAGFHLQ
jgi:thiamine biosynthesis lipoprotein